MITAQEREKQKKRAEELKKQFNFSGTSSTNKNDPWAEFDAQRAERNQTLNTTTQPEKKKGLLEKASNIGEKTFGRLGGVLFGSAAKATGTLLLSGVQAARELINPKAKETPLFKEEQIKGGDIAWTAIELYPGGGAVTKALKKIPGGSVVAKYLMKLPEALKAQAIKQYSEALAPTTKALKVKTEKFVPELLNRGVVGSLKKVGQKAGQVIETVGSKIDDLIEALPKEKQTVVKPLINSVQQWKKQFIVDGVVAEPQAVKVADDMIETIAQLGKKTSDDALIRLRRVWDNQISKRKGFEKGLDEITSFSLDVKKEATNSIRNILAKSHPDLAALNKEFSLWKNVDEIVQGTLKRTAGQSGKVRERVGAVAGAIIGSSGGPITAAVGAYAGKLLTSIFNAAAYKTRSAVLKNRIADAIISGNIQALFLIAKELGVSIKNLTDKD